MTLQTQDPPPPMAVVLEDQSVFSKYGLKIIALAFWFILIGGYIYIASDLPSVDDLQARANRRGAAGHGHGASNRPHVVGPRRERRHEGGRRRPRRRRVLAA
mgnify:CR=1 FL=1